MRSPVLTLNPAEDPYDAVVWWRKMLDAPLFVYFIQDGEDGPVKIGKAMDPKSRLAELQCGNPRQLSLRAVVLAAEDTEAALHLSWSHAHVRGEWFDGWQDEILRRARNAQAKQVEERPDPRIGRQVYDVARLASAMVRCPSPPYAVEGGLD